MQNKAFPVVIKAITEPVGDGYGYLGIELGANDRGPKFFGRFTVPAAVWQRSCTQLKCDDICMVEMEKDGNREEVVASIRLIDDGSLHNDGEGLH
jgi:hypothetical protein